MRRDPTWRAAAVPRQVRRSYCRAACRAPAGRSARRPATGRLVAEGCRRSRRCTATAYRGASAGREADEPRVRRRPCVGLRGTGLARDGHAGDLRVRCRCRAGRPAPSSRCSVCGGRRRHRTSSTGVGSIVADRPRRRRRGSASTTCGSMITPPFATPAATSAICERRRRARRPGRCRRGEQRGVVCERSGRRARCCATAPGSRSSGGASPPTPKLSMPGANLSPRSRPICANVVLHDSHEALERACRRTCRRRSSSSVLSVCGQVELAAARDRRLVGRRRCRSSSADGAGHDLERRAGRVDLAVRARRASGLAGSALSDVKYVVRPPSCRGRRAASGRTSGSSTSRRSRRSRRRARRPSPSGPPSAACRGAAAPTARSVSTTLPVVSLPLSTSPRSFNCELVAPGELVVVGCARRRCCRR